MVLMAALMVMGSTVCYAGDNTIQPISNVIHVNITGVTTTVQIVCIGGYKYAIARTPNGVSITQMYKEGTYSGSIPPQPIKCNE